MNNQFYTALLEGRFPIHVETLPGPSGDTWVARFEDTQGHVFEVEDSSQAEAHRQCTAQVIEAIRTGDVVPAL